MAMVAGFDNISSILSLQTRENEKICIDEIQWIKQNLYSLNLNDLRNLKLSVTTSPKFVLVYGIGFLVYPYLLPVIIVFYMGTAKNYVFTLKV